MGAWARVEAETGFAMRDGTGRSGLVWLWVMALVCAYLTLCLLFYQGQWQLVLHPKRTEAHPAAIDGRPIEVVRFGPDATGVPQRVGWWIPAAAETPFRHLVVLYLPAGDGSLVDATATLDAIARTGIAVFAMDYRGYGASAVTHLSEQAMREDAEAGWQYVVGERHVPGGRVLPYGAGVGAALALDLAGEHRETAAVLLDGPRYDIEKDVRKDPRVSALPVSLLLKDRFALEPALGQGSLPKLIITRAAQEDARSLAAANPKMTMAMPGFDAATMDGGLRRFLSQYAPPSPETSLAPAMQR